MFATLWSISSASSSTNGGRVWACGACTAPRGITADDLIEGASIVTAANLVEAVTGGAKTIGF